MAHALKTAISLPAADFAFLEKTRKREKKTRSEVIQEALRLWQKQQEREELERRYVEGYQKHPENKANLLAFSRAGLHSFSKEKW